MSRSPAVGFEIEIPTVMNVLSPKILPEDMLPECVLLVVIVALAVTTLELPESCLHVLVIGAHIFPHWVEENTSLSVTRTREAMALGHARLDCNKTSLVKKVRALDTALLNLVPTVRKSEHKNHPSALTSSRTQSFSVYFIPE